MDPQKLAPILVGIFFFLVTYLPNAASNDPTLENQLEAQRVFKQFMQEIVQETPSAQANPQGLIDSFCSGECADATATRNPNVCENENIRCI